MGFDGNRSRLAQEIEPVLSRVGRDASNDPLSKDLSIVVERRNRRHMNTGEGERAASFQGTQGRWNQFPAGAKMIELWSLSGGWSVAPPTHEAPNSRARRWCSGFNELT